MALEILNTEKPRFGPEMDQVSCQSTSAAVQGGNIFPIKNPSSLLNFTLRGAGKERKSLLPANFQIAPVKVISHWIGRYRQRRQLLSLDDRMLNDIGLTRLEAHQEGGKWFWQK